MLSCDGTNQLMSGQSMKVVFQDTFFTTRRLQTVGQFILQWQTMRKSIIQLVAILLTQLMNMLKQVLTRQIPQLLMQLVVLIKQTLPIFMLMRHTHKQTLLHLLMNMLTVPQLKQILHTLGLTLRTYMLTVPQHKPTLVTFTLMRPSIRLTL